MQYPIWTPKGTESKKEKEMKTQEEGLWYWIKAMFGILVIIIVSIIVGVSGYLKEYSDKLLRRE